MFYFYLTIAYYSFLSLIAQLLLLRMGYFSVLSSFVVTAFISFAFGAMAYQRFKGQHERSKLVYSIGLWIAVFGLASAFLKGNFLSPVAFCLGILTSSIFASYGLIVMLYNKEIYNENTIVESVESHDESRMDLIYAVIFKIDEILGDRRLNYSKRFFIALYNCQLYLIELNRLDYPVREALLEQMLDLLNTYCTFKGSLLPTESCIETIEKIENSFNKIEEALYNMYQSATAEMIDEAQIKAEVVERYLQLNGYLEDGTNKNSERI